MQDNKTGLAEAIGSENLLSLVMSIGSVFNAHGVGEKLDMSDWDIAALALATLDIALRKKEEVKASIAKAHKR